MSDRPLQFIDGDGNFNDKGLDAFLKEVKLPECGVSYAVVSIMGPQSGGKSTLLNHLFGTKFAVMNAKKGMSQTTKGVWVAKCVGIEPCTLAIDLEGSDGIERGQDDIVFEKRSALFALAVSDVVLINMWCHETGRENAGSRPLLGTVFEERMSLVSSRKTTLLFVIRDKPKETPPEILEKNLRKSIEQIYDSVAKLPNRQKTPLNEIFNVEVISLSNYEYMEEEFKEQVAKLRLRFINSIGRGGLAEDQGDKLPASEFSFSSQKMWETIVKNNNLNLPTHKEMVANIRCEHIANDQFAHFKQNKDWLRLKTAVQSGLVLDFGKTLNSIIHACLSEYDTKVAAFKKSVANAKRQILQDRIIWHIEPAYQSMLEHLHSRTLDKFKKAFTSSLNGGKLFVVAARDCKDEFRTEFYNECKDAAIEQANFNSSNIRNKLLHDMIAHVASVRDSKLSELQSHYEQKLSRALSERVEALLNEAEDNTWLNIRKHLQHETDSSLVLFSKDILGFDIDQKTKDEMRENIESYARRVVQAKARESAGRVMIQMKDRFSTVFNSTETWTGNVDIAAIAKTAYSASLKLLSVMAADRLDGDADNIANTLDALLDSTGNSANDKSILTSNTWEKVPSSKTFITPVKCKSIWGDFKAAMEHQEVRAAIMAQEAAMRAKAAEADLDEAEAKAGWANALVAKLKAFLGEGLRIASAAIANFIKIFIGDLSADVVVDALRKE